MKKYLSRLLSAFLSVTMVFSSAIFTNINVMADLTTQQMASNGLYNLALGKNVEVMPSIQEGKASYLTDGEFTKGGNHASTTFGKTGTYFQVDLGATYDISTLDQIVVGYKEKSDGDTPVKGYKIQISANGLDFTTVMDVPGSSVTAATDTDDLIEIESLEGLTGIVRYVRLYYPDSYTWGIQATEIAVLDVDGDAAQAQVEPCDDAAAVNVEASDYNEIKYSIVAGDEQEGYKYLVYLDGTTLVGMGVEAGTEYTVSSVTGGSHTLKVVSAYDGKASEGIVSQQVIVQDVADLINSKKNVTNKNYNPLVQVTSVSSLYTDHTITTAQNMVDGKTTTGEGKDVCLRTGAGAPQTIIVDLGDYYTPDEFERVLLTYTNQSTYAADTYISFSLDGNTFKEVGSSKDYKFEATSSGAGLNQVKLNKISDYTESAVRYVKIVLSNGASNWGYVVNEFSLIANTDNPTIKGSDIPEAADIITDTSKLEAIKYTIVAGEEQEDATYIVKLDGQVINSEAKAGVEYEYSGLDTTTYELKVCTLEDGWQSKGISKNITVDGYTNYIMTSLNLVYKALHPDVTATCDNDNYGDNYLTGSQEISAGVVALNNGAVNDNGHHTGYLQTRPDSDEANIIYDLGADYNKDTIHSVISVYESKDRAATEYEIYASATGDEGTYEKVFYIKDAQYTKYMNDVLDMSKYTQDTVRYIKYHIITGNYSKHYNEDGSINWGADGYHIQELAVMGDQTLLPDIPKNIQATSPEFKKLVVKWDDVDDPDVVYNIYINGSCVAMNIEAGVNEKTFTISRGIYTVTVSSVKNQIEHKAQNYSVVVEEETTTASPTTVAPTKTTTKAPVTTAKTVNPTSSVTTSANSDVVSQTGNVSKPAKVKITKIKAGKKKVLLKFKRVAGAKGYRIQYSLKANFNKSRYKIVKKLSYTIKGLASKKRYFFRVQAFKIVNGKKLYGPYGAKKRSKKIK